MVVPISSLQQIVTRATAQGIVARTACKRIITRIALEIVVTQAAAQIVIAGIAVEIVVAIAGLCDQRLDRLDTPNRAIAEADKLHRMGCTCILLKIGLNDQLIGRSPDSEDQIGVQTPCTDHLRRDPFAQLYRVCLHAQGVAVVVVNPILTRAQAKEVDVRAVIALQVVIACTTI